MIDSTLEFHPAHADLAKQRGMSLAEANSTDLLRIAQGTAIGLWCRLRRPITVDDVFKFMEECGHHPEMMGNASGSIFKFHGWKPVGFVKSIRVSNHSRIIREWVRR